MPKSSCESQKGSVFSPVLVVYGYLLHLLLLQHGDTESNPGTRNEQINKNLLWCHWNINSLLAHNLAKISQIEAYNSLFNNFICISETYFDLSVFEGDRSFQLNGVAYSEQIIQATQNEEVFVSITKTLCVSVK